MRKLIIIGALLLCALAAGIYFLGPGAIAIEAQIIYNLGGPQPVARQAFYLLNADPRQLPNATLENGGLVFHAMTGSLSLYQQYAEVRQVTSAEELKKNLATFSMTRPFWQPYVVATAETDFKGLARMAGLRAGRYWLMGMAETRAGIAFWSLPVTVRPWRTSQILLDQNNALFSK